METEVLNSAVYTSKDGFRIEATYTVTPDVGDPYVTVKSFRRDRHATEMAAVEAAVTVAPFVRPKRAGMELQDEITGKFWEKVSEHFGVPVSRAQTHVGVMGAPAAVQTLWGKATALMDNPAISLDDIEDNANW